jgi:hypothetical protein
VQETSLNLPVIMEWSSRKDHTLDDALASLRPESGTLKLSVRARAAKPLKSCTDWRLRIVRNTLRGPAKTLSRQQS